MRSSRQRLFLVYFSLPFSLVSRRGFTITYGTCSLDDDDLSRCSYLKKRGKCKIGMRVYVWLGCFKTERKKSRDFESMVWDWESLAWCLVGERYVKNLVLAVYLHSLAARCSSNMMYGYM